MLLVVGCGSTATSTPTADAAPSPDTGPDSALDTPLADASRNPEDAPPPADASVAADTAPPPSFGEGIYYRQPNATDPSALLARITPPLTRMIRMSPVGFDLRGDRAVFPYPAGLTVVDSQGRQRNVPLIGLHGVVRPSLSPDGKRAAVQAATTPDMPAMDLNIYVVDLDTGSHVRVGTLGWNEESPEWFPRSNRIAYSSFSATEGVDLHVFDLDANRETLSIKDGGALHLAISPDETRIIDFWRLRIYDTTSGAVIGELKDKLIAALPATGFAIDGAHPGLGGRQTFVLDGAFSPDGASLVFDGAVTGNGASGLVLFRTALDPVSLTALTPIIPINYDFSNQNNYSQCNPVWR
jgi:hypothetical protein